MKPILSIIIFLLFGCTVLYSQPENIFILIDVSGSINKVSIKEEGRSLVKDLILGQFDNSKYDSWEPRDIADNKIQKIIGGSHSPLVDVNSSVFIIPFGNKDRYQDYEEKTVRSYPSDFESFFDGSYPRYFTDEFTYISIAEAYSVQLAKDKSIESYYMFLITDMLGDQDETGSATPNFTTDEKNLIDAYNASSSQVTGIGVIRTSKHNDYRIVMKKVNVKGITGIQTHAPSPVSQNITPKLIINNPKGKRNNPSQYNNNKVAVNWTCTGCPSGTKYRILIQGVDESNKEVRIIQENITGISYTAEIKKSGVYRVQVSANGMPPQQAYFEMVSGSGKWLLVFLLIAGGLAALYYLWNKKRRKDPYIQEQREEKSLVDRLAGRKRN